MSWSQDIGGTPPRPRWDLYLDGLVTGGVLTWLMLMLYGLFQREHAGTFGLVLFGAVILLLFVVTLVKVWRLRKRGD